MSADGGMKVSYAAAGLILVVCAMIGWQGRTREAALREERSGLQDRAGVAGIATDEADGNGRVTKVARGEPRAVDAKDFARRLIGMIKLAESGDGELEEEAANRLLDEMELLDPEGALVFLEATEAEAGLEAAAKDGVLGIVILCLGPGYPKESLALLAKTEDLDPGGEIYEDFIATTLGRLAKSDPQAAVEWLRENKEKDTSQVGEDSKLGIIAGTAVADPRLAFQLIRELEVEDASDGVEKIMGAGTTDAERIEIAKALREEIAKTGDEDAKEEMVSGAFGEMARGAMDAGLVNSREWLENVKMSPEEMEAFSEGAADRVASGECPGGEVAGWLEWMGKADLTEEASDNLESMAETWTEKDHKAVGRWLEAAPEGRLKELVAKGYRTGMKPKQGDFTTPRPNGWLDNPGTWHKGGELPTIREGPGPK